MKHFLKGRFSGLIHLFALCSLIFLLSACETLQQSLLERLGQQPTDIFGEFSISTENMVVEVSWDNPTDNITEIIVLRRDFVNPDETTEIYVGTGNMFLDPAPVAGIRYLYEITTIIGGVFYSAVVDATVGDPFDELVGIVIDQSDDQAPGEAQNLDIRQSTPTPSQTIISWTNPEDEDFSHVVLVRQENVAPQAPTDGVVVAATESPIHQELEGSTAYFFRLYTVDRSGNISNGLQYASAYFRPDLLVDTNPTEETDSESSSEEEAEEEETITEEPHQEEAQTEETSQDEAQAEETHQDETQAEETSSETTHSEETEASDASDSSETHDQAADEPPASTNNTDEPVQSDGLATEPPVADPEPETNQKPDLTAPIVFEPDHLVTAPPAVDDGSEPTPSNTDEEDQTDTTGDDSGDESDPETNTNSGTNEGSEQTDGAENTTSSDEDNSTDETDTDNAEETVVEEVDVIEEPVVEVDTTPPSAVLFPVFEVENNSEVQISWTHPADDDLDQIIVLRTRDTAATQLDDVAEQRWDLTRADNPFVVDSNLDEEVDYFYTIFTLDAAGNSASFSSPAMRLEDTTAPGQVQGLTATADDSNGVEVNWGMPADSDLDYVRIVRSQGQAVSTLDDTGEKTWDFNPTDAGHLADNTFAYGTDYYYTAFAVDSNGNYSVVSTDQAIRFEEPVVIVEPEPEADTTPPGELINVQFFNNAREVQFAWELPADDDIASIVVERYIPLAAQVDFFSIGVVTEWTETDPPMVAPHLYVFIVTDHAGNETRMTQIQVNPQFVNR